MSINFFFENVNYAQRQKVWATKITRFGEIWWFFPRITDENPNPIECNWAVIYNIREQTWYDTEIHRGTGYFTQVFTRPIWGDNNGAGPYSVWIHETSGYNQVDVNNNPTAIDSYIETSIFSLCAYGIDGQFGGTDKNEYLYRIEPDFNQVGQMNLIVKGREYANSPVVCSNPYNFMPNTTKIDMREQRREMSLRFESNDIDGFYEMGQILAVVKPGDDRP